MEAIYTIIGVVLGAVLTWLQTYWTKKGETQKNAKYLAVRIMPIINQYLQVCIDVVKDDGLYNGQRTNDGCLEPQIKTPGAPVFPNDVDWKSIDDDLMFKLLSFPTQIADGNQNIKFAWEITGPPDYEEWFDERIFYYTQFGLIAYKLSEDLSKTYGIKMRTFDHWDPIEFLRKDFDAVCERRHLGKEECEKIIKDILG